MVCEMDSWVSKRVPSKSKITRVVMVAAVVSATGEIGVQFEGWEDNSTPGLEKQETRGF